jgi:hypothetical protein
VGRGGRSPAGAGSGHSVSDPSPVPGLGHTASVPNAFAPIRRFCRCRAARVDTTDHANRTGSVVAVHGLLHCFGWRVAT